MDYNLALNLDSTDYVNLTNRALVKLYLKNYRGAIDDCDKAIKYNVNYAYAYFHKGLSQAQLDKYKESILSYDKAIKIDSTFARAFYNRGSSKFALDNLAGACVDWQKADALGNKTAISMIQKYCNSKSSQ